MSRPLALAVRQAILGTAAGGLLAGASASAYAQLEEVIVTATKRSASTQDIPVSVQALGENTLNDMGVTVQDKLDARTDYLIVGSEVYVDEDGEPYEEPRQPSDMAVYKEAEAKGVGIVPLKDIREYFRK